MLHLRAWSYGASISCALPCVPLFVLRFLCLGGGFAAVAPSCCVSAYAGFRCVSHGVSGANSGGPIAATGNRWRFCLLHAYCIRLFVMQCVTVCPIHCSVLVLCGWTLSVLSAE